MRKTFRFVLLILLAIILILILCGVYLARRDYTGYFFRARGSLVDSQVRRFGVDSVFEREWLSLRNNAGISVDCGLLVPAKASEPRRYPVIVLLGGKTTGKHAIDYALDIRDVIIAAPDYPYTPRDSYTFLSFLSDVPQMRKAALNMVPTVMLLIDYLRRRPDVDTNRVVLIGYSFGAPFATCVSAIDKRVSVCAVVFGGGNLCGLIRHNVRRYQGKVVGELVGMLGGLLLSPLEPLRYVGRISPVPLIMINGREDEQVPPVYANLLYEEAREPKRIVWLEARHVNPRNVELTRKIVTVLKGELVRMNILSWED